MFLKATFFHYLYNMTTITIDKNINLSKLHFKNLEELQLALLLLQEEQEISIELKDLLDERLEMADNSDEKGYTIDELIASIKR